MIFIESVKVGVANTNWVIYTLVSNIPASTFVDEEKQPVSLSIPVNFDLSHV